MMHISSYLTLTILASLATIAYAIPVVRRDLPSDCSQPGSCTGFDDAIFTDKFKPGKSIIDRAFPTSTSKLIPSKPAGIDSRDSVRIQITNIKLDSDEDGMFNKSNVSIPVSTSTSITRSTSVTTAVHIITQIITTSMPTSSSSAVASTSGSTTTRSSPSNSKRQAIVKTTAPPALAPTATTVVKDVLSLQLEGLG